MKVQAESVPEEFLIGRRGEEKGVLYIRMLA